LPHLFTPQLINSLRSLTGGIGAQSVTRVELRQGGRVRFMVDETLQRAVRRTTFEEVARESTIVGRLHMGDFSPATLRCRIDTYAGSVPCDFDSDLRDVVLDAMDQMVMAEGLAEVEPNGSRVRILHLAALRRLDTAQSKSLDELAREQGVRPIRSIEELQGAPAEDMEEFLAALRSARGEGENA
jgi:ADP-ribose pyrophosphatase YjhB (NUDIX family)